MLRRRRTVLTLFVLDSLATLVVFNVVGSYRGIIDHFIFSPLLGPVLALLLALHLIDGYNAFKDMPMLEYASLHIIAVLSAMLGILLLTYVFRFSPEYELQSSRGVIAFSFLALIPVTLAYREMIRQEVLTRRGERAILFVGDATSCAAFCEEYGRMEMPQPLIVSQTGTEPADPAPSFSETLASVRAGRTQVEAIVLRESNRDLLPETERDLVRLYFEGVPTYTLELFHQVYWKKIPLYRINPTWLFQEGFQIAREPVFERLKRASDIGLSVLGLVLSAPLVAAAALAIWIEDRESAWFIQTRIGRNHVPFRLIKLRSMRTNRGTNSPYTLPRDSRITRVGRFLRATRLDELPQLWNVLRGEMSLIGPRAEWDRLVEDYARQIPCYDYRHLVKPGITGWAQINYRYGASLEDTVRKLEYDLYYIRHFSFVMDASIMMRTIQIMMFGKGR